MSDMPDVLIQAAADVLAQNGLWGGWKRQQTEDEVCDILAAVLPLYTQPIAGRDADICGATFTRAGRQEFICLLEPHEGRVHANPGAIAWGVIGDSWVMERGASLPSGYVRNFMKEARELNKVAEQPQDEPFFEPGHAYMSKNRAFRFTCERLVDGIALGVEERLDGRPQFASNRVWKSVMPEGCWNDVTTEQQYQNDENGGAK